MPELTIAQSVPLEPDKPSPFAPAASASRDIPGLLDRKADQYGVPRPLMRTVAQLESSLDPNADSGKAQGLMQLEPRTARRLGVTDPFDAEQSADAGARLLSELIGQNNGDTRRVLAGYNAGQGAVNRHGGVPPYPETQKYVARGMKSLPDNVSLAQQSSGIPAAAAQDFFGKIARGETSIYDVTPEMLAGVVRGAPQAAPAPKPEEQPVTIAQSVPLPPPPPQKPPLTLGEEVQRLG